MSIEKRTFKKHTHVKWFDFFEDGEFKHGIAFNGVVICSCCGGVIPLEEIYEAAEAFEIENPIIEFPYWPPLFDPKEFEE